MDAYEELLNKCYELYKKDWCAIRGYDPSLVAEAYEHGEEYNREMYVGLGEFESCEFQYEEYMSLLLEKELHNKTEVQNMNKYEAERRFAQRMKDNYPPGTRILLINMGDDPRPVESNTRGTVMAVDDIGTLHCDFDNGRSLGIVPGEDSFRKLTEKELAEEKIAKMPHIEGSLVPLTSDDCESFMGYTTDRKWNGWECPWFPKSSADKIMAHINSEGGDMEYDAQQDSYTVKYSPDGDEEETFTGTDCVVNGTIEHLYPIGSHSWIWDRAEPEQSKDLDENNSPVMGM